MRVPDILLQNIFLNNLNTNKSSLSKLQNQIATQSKINKPSDGPLANSRIMRLTNQLSDTEMFSNNIGNSLSFVDHTILSLEGIEEQMQNVMSDLAKVNDGSLDDFGAYVASLDLAIDAMMDSANNDFNGQFIFGGTDHSKKPFSIDTGNGVLQTDSQNSSGGMKVRIAKNIQQKINIPGGDLFIPKLTQSGNLDSTAGVGVPQNDSMSVYDADGNQYTMNLTYTMTAANTYDLNYTIVDGGGATINNTTVNNIVFNSLNGEVESIDGNTTQELKVNLPTDKINLTIDLSSLNESTSATNLKSSLSQKADIISTLISIRDGLKLGNKPNAEQVQIVNDFHDLVLDNLSKAGAIVNRLEDSDLLLQNQMLEIQTLISKEKDVDMAKAIIDLQTQQYSLDLSYKMSSTILPKSLMDFL